MAWKAGPAELRRPTPANGNRLIVVGAGGHAKVVIECARSVGWRPVAAFDPGQVGRTVLGVPVRGSDDDIEAFWTDGHCDCAVVAIGANDLRKRLAGRIRALGCPTPSIVHPGAWISPTAEIGQGVVVMAGAVVNAEATVKRDCIINTCAVVEHDCRLGEAVHMAPRSVLGGGCRIGTETLFGIGATARPEIRVGKRAIVGGGSVVVADVLDMSTVFGNPARRV